MCYLELLFLVILYSFIFLNTRIFIKYLTNNLCNNYFNNQRSILNYSLIHQKCMYVSIININIIINQYKLQYILDYLMFEPGTSTWKNSCKIFHCYKAFSLSKEKETYVHLLKLFINLMFVLYEYSLLLRIGRTALNSSLLIIITDYENQIYYLFYRRQRNTSFLLKIWLLPWFIVVMEILSTGFKKIGET